MAASQQICLRLRARLIDKLDLHSTAATSAELVNTLHDGVDNLADYYAGYLPTVTYSAFIPLAILAVVLPIDWQSGLILLLTAPVIPLFMVLIGTKAQTLNQQNWRTLLRLGNHFLDRVQGIAQLKIFNAAERELKAVDAVCESYRSSTMGVLKIAFLSSLTLEFLASISVALVAVTIGFRLYWGELSFYQGFAVLLLAPEFYLPLRQLGSQYHAKLKAVASAEQIAEQLQTAEVSEAISLAEKTPLPIHSLALEQASYRYPQGAVGLNNASLSVTGPGLYVLVGASGSGKSTLLDALLGFCPLDLGQVLVNGQALDVAQLAYLRQQLAWVPQQPTLFADSIAANVALAEALPDRAKVELALEQASALDFVNQLPEGIDTQLGEMGAGLSGGQRQRIALARAFYKQAPVLLLDEPAAALDSASEAKINAAIGQYAKQHMVLLVAHRLAALDGADKVLVMQEGELVQAGTVQQLLAIEGPLKRMLAASSEMSYE